MAETSWIDLVLDAIYGKDPHPTPEPAAVKPWPDSSGSVSRLSFFPNPERERFAADLRPRPADTLAPEGNPQKTNDEDDDMPLAVQEESGFKEVFIEYTGKPLRSQATEGVVRRAAAPISMSAPAHVAIERTLDLGRYRKVLPAPVSTQPAVKQPSKPKLDLSRYRRSAEATNAI